MITLLLTLLLTFAPPDTIWAGGDRFIPSEISVQVGDTLVWAPSPVIHGVAEITGEFYLQATGDSTATWAPRRPGTYRYVCPSHVSRGMHGTITVLPDTTG